MASLIVGQTIKVKGPKGAMVYTPNMVRHFGMIAGGTGITPMLQIIRAVIRGRPIGDTTEIDLIFANVNLEDILLKGDLDQLAKDDSKFRVHYVLNNPPEKWQGGVGFVTPEMMTVWFPFHDHRDCVLIWIRNGFLSRQATSSSFSADLLL
jgi:cytochrome-b5 reductase